MRFILRGRRSISWTCRLTFVAPRIVMTFHMWRGSIMNSFCVAGAVFGEVGVWLFVAGAAFRAILGDSRSAKCCIFPYKMRLQDGTTKVSEAAGARWRFYRRLSSDYVRNVVESSFYWRKQFTEFPLKSCTDFVAGAVFGEVGGWLCLLRAL